MDMDKYNEKEYEDKDLEEVIKKFLTETENGDFVVSRDCCEQVWDPVTNREILMLCHLQRTLTRIDLYQFKYNFQIQLLYCLLKQNRTSLRELGIGACPVTGNETVFQLPIFPYLPHLKKLNIRYDIHLTDSIDFVLKFPELEEFNFSSIDERDVQAEMKVLFPRDTEWESEKKPHRNLRQLKFPFETPMKKTLIMKLAKSFPKLINPCVHYKDSNSKTNKIEENSYWENKLKNKKKKKISDGDFMKLTVIDISML